MATTTFNGPVVSQNGFTSDAGSTFTINGQVVIMSNLPTADPTNAGQLWNNAGALAVSAG